MRAQPSLPPVVDTNPPIVPLVAGGIPGISWPALPGAAGACMLALQYQLEQSEWWPPERLREQQACQLELLLRHAGDTVPFYRERFPRYGFEADREFSFADFERLPPLTRAEVQQAGRAVLSERMPPDHAPFTDGVTSGSTGAPLRFVSSGLEQFFWHAFTLRNHLWHHDDFSARFASIRVGLERNDCPGWGLSTDAVFRTGPAAGLDAREDIDVQVDWLLEQQPAYLLSHASNLRALAVRFKERSLRLDALRQAKSFSEMMPADLREQVRAAWNVEVVDVYSANEAGYIALQCPQCEHYHVQSEGALVEVVDEHGEPCPAGGVGRVLITTLHNFAMPLIRYEVGDCAEVGENCPCGRGLPVLRRVMGRVRNMLRLPGGGSFWPGVPLNALTGLAPVRQFRVIQRTLTEIELQLVLDRELSAAEEEGLREALRVRLRYPFDVRVVRVDRIERGPGHKFEDFVCQVP